MNAGLRAPNKWWVFVTVSCGSLMASIDVSVVNLALPALQSQYHISLAQVEWVVLSYLLVLTSLLLTMGRLADVLGRGRLYSWGFIAFTVGSVLCGAAPSVPVLIGFRALQAVGSSMLISSSTAILLDAFPANQRGQALGLTSTVFALGSMIGPTLGGALLTWFGWRSIFYVNVPIGIVGFVLAYVIIADPPRDAKRRPLDLPGAFCLSVGLCALLVALTRGFDQGPTAGAFQLLTIPGVIFLGLFILVEKRTPDPTIDLGLFSGRVFAGANAAKVFAYCAMSSVTFLMPFYLEQALHYSPTLTGLGMTALPIALAAGSMTGGPLSDRFGSHVLAPIGMIVAASGALVLARISPDAGYPPAMVAMLLLGLGMGLFIVPNDSAIMGAAPRDKLGVASGILATTRNLGLSSGIAFAGTLLAARVQIYSAAHLTVVTPFVAAFRDVYLITIAMC
ncbi:MAG: MFS transporter, partial [Chloroflexota bacterium]